MRGIYSAKLQLYVLLVVSLSLYDIYIYHIHKYTSYGVCMFIHMFIHIFPCNSSQQHHMHAYMYIHRMSFVYKICIFCANNTLIDRQSHTSTNKYGNTRTHAHTNTHTQIQNKQKGKKRASLGGLEVGGDGIEVVAEARGDAHARHHHALQAVDHLDLHSGHS